MRAGGRGSAGLVRRCVGPSGSASYASGEAGWIPCSAPPVAAAASLTCFSSAPSTFPTCWLMIGCSTRWPIAPTGPAIFTSASQRIVVPVPFSARLNWVAMFMIAPTPLPFAFSCANSGWRSSTFSKSIVIRSPPRPSGIFTFACQWRSSLISKPSTPGISFAIWAGSFSTCQTTSRGALSSFVPSTFTPARPRRSRASTPGPGASTRRGGRGCSCRRRSAHRQA